MTENVNFFIRERMSTQTAERFPSHRWIAPADAS